MPYSTGLEQVGIDKGFQQGFRQGFRQGFQEGFQEGFQQGRASLVLRQLTRRFGMLPPAVHDRILLLNAVLLEELGEAFLDFTDASDVTAWLEAHAQTNGS
jgi:flagellar biosynthesis/type III secretory pathway protein FliH